MRNWLLVTLLNSSFQHKRYGFPFKEITRTQTLTIHSTFADSAILFRSICVSERVSDVETNIGIRNNIQRVLFQLNGHYNKATKAYGEYIQVELKAVKGY